jgi:hypothetical protein
MNNSLSKALDIVLRREWEKTSNASRLEEQNAENMRRGVRNLIRKIPKDRRMFKIIRNVTADETAIHTLKKAVKNRNMNVIKKIYRPQFFFDIAEDRRLNMNANVLKAIVPTKTSPKILIQHLLYKWAKPSVIAHVMTIRDVSAENFIDIATSRDRILSVYDFMEYTLSSDILEILKLFEKRIGKHVDLRKISRKKMIDMFESRFDESSDPRSESSSMEILTLLEFMARRGAPLVPLETVLWYAVHYLDKYIEDVEWIGQPEFFKLLHLYDDRESVPRKVMWELFVKYANGTSDDVRSRVGTFREILDRIKMDPNDTLMFLFAAFSKSEYQPSIPNGIIDYLIARGAKRTPGALSWFEKYARRFVGTPALVADAYKTMLEGLNINNLKKVRPFSNMFKNIVDHVKTSRGIQKPPSPSRYQPINLGRSYASFRQ